MEVLARQVLIERLGIWPFVVRGINTGSFWTKNPLKGAHSGVQSSYVLVVWLEGVGVRLRFWVQQEVKVLSSAHAWTA